jgi:hypothetical protein
MRLRTIEIYASPAEGFGTTKPLLVHNVAYIYSKLLARRKAECAGIKRLNIYLRSETPPQRKHIEGGFADIDVGFSTDGIDVDDPIGTQLRLAGVIKVVLKELCSGGGSGSESLIDEVHDEVVATGFSTEDLVIKDWQRSPNKKYAARVGMRTAFDRTSMFLEFRVERGPVSRMQLFAMRPAPFIAYMAVKSVSVDDGGAVEVTLRHPGEKYLNSQLLGLSYYDTVEADVAPRVDDRKDAVVLRLQCA